MAAKEEDEICMSICVYMCVKGLLVSSPEEGHVAAKEENEICMSICVYMCVKGPFREKGPADSAAVLFF